MAVPASVSGTVTSNDPNVSPDGFQLGIYQGATLVGTAVTDSNGNYTIGGLAAGSYNIEPITSTVIPINIPVIIAAGQTLTGENLVAQPGATIAGSVDNSTNQSGIAGITVFAKNAAGSLFTGVTNGSGAYDITGLLSGTYQVFVQGVANQTQSVPVTDQTGETSATASFDFPLTDNTSLNGEVLDSSGNPITNADVMLEQNNQVVAQAISDSNGDYGFLLEAGGTYSLAVISANGSFATLTGVDVTTGDTLTQNLTAGSSSLQVTASDSAGTVVGDYATLYLQTAGGPVVAGFGQVGSDGTVTFGNLINGNYLAVVQSGSTVGQITQSVSGATQASVTLLAGLTLTGTVSNSGSSAIPGATVSLVSSSTGLTVNATADANGNYSFGLLAAGTYTVVAAAANYQTLVQSGVSVTANTQTNLTLANADRTVTGTVVDSNSNDIQVGTVTATDSAGDVLDEVSLQNNGAFSLGMLSGTAFTLTVTVNGYAPLVETNLTVNSAQNENLGSLTLTPLALVQNQASLSSVALVQAASATGLSPQDVGANIQVAAQAYLKEIQTIISGVLTAILPDKLQVPTQPLCPDCQDEFAAAVKAVNQFNNFHDNVMVPDAKAFAKLTGIFLFTVGVESLAVASQIYIIYINLPFIVTALNAGIVGGVGSGAAATSLALIQEASAMNGVVQSVVSLVNAMAQVQGAQGIQQQATKVGMAGIPAFLLYGSLQTYFGGPNPNPLIPPVVSAIGSAALGIISSYSITQSLAPQFQVQYNNFNKLYTQYKKLRAAAVTALAAYATCLGRSGNSGSITTDDATMSCGNRGQGAGSTDGAISGGGSNSRTGSDPNDMTGPAGYGPQNYVQADQPLGYTIDFTNEANAEAPTAVVTITDVLGSNLDLSTFSLGNFGFSGITVDVPAGVTSYSTLVDDIANSGWDVQVSASLDVQTRTVTWTFTTIDPTTGDTPANPIAGFLPPDVNGSGEGFVTYNVSPDAGLPTGTVIDAQASVVFDANAAIATPLVSNTLDATAPTSSVMALPSNEAPQFTLQWGGANVGSGIADYNIYYSEDNGPWLPFLLNTAKTAAVFNGVIGDTYSFYSVAIDNVGNIEAAPVTANTSTTIAQPALVTIDSKHSFKFTDANGNIVTVKLTGAGSAVAMLQGGVANDADLRSLTLSGTTSKSALTITVKKAGGGNGTTNIEEIMTGDPSESLASITLGPGVSLGSPVDDGSVSLDLTGGVGALTLGGLNPDAQLTAGGAIGKITLDESNQTGSAAAIDDATVTAAGIGNISVTLKGAAALSSATGILDSTFTAGAGDIGNITVLVNSSDPTAILTAISGSAFTAAGSIGVISATAADTAKSPTGGSATAIANGDGSVDFTAGASIGGVKASASGSGGANIALDGASGTPIDFTAGASIGAITLSASKAKNGSSSAFAAEDIDIVAATSIGKVAISGKATQTQADDFNMTAGGGIAGISISSAGSAANGSLADSIILAGQSTNISTNAELKKAGIGAITLTGSLIGDPTSLTSTIGAYGDIGAVSIGGGMTNMSLAAGFNAGPDGVVYTSDDFFNDNASIASVKVGGQFSDSSIVAGVSPGADEHWGATDDAIGMSLAGVTVKSKIDAITLGAATLAAGDTNPFRSPATGIELSAIESLALTSVKIGSLKPLTSFTASHWIDPTANGTEASSDTAIAVLT